MAKVVYHEKPFGFGDVTVITVASSSLIFIADSYSHYLITISQKFGPVSYFYLMFKKQNKGSDAFRFAEEFSIVIGKSTWRIAEMNLCFG